MSEKFSKIALAVFVVISTAFARPDGGHQSGQGGNGGQNGGNGGNNNNGAITVTISFESQIICTDVFFSQQLNTEIFKKFAKCSTVKWEFEPCEESYLKNGKLTCPGDDENLCQLDRVQACVAELAHDQVKNGLFVTCMMNTREPMTAAPGCCKAAGLDWSQIDQCAKNGQGDQYCDKLYKRINARNPQWIPSLMLDGKYDENVHQQLKTNFSKTLCDKLKQKNLECSACSNNN